MIFVCIRLCFNGLFRSLAPYFHPIRKIDTSVAVNFSISQQLGWRTQIIYFRFCLVAFLRARCSLSFFSRFEHKYVAVAHCHYRSHWNALAAICMNANQAKRIEPILVIAWNFVSHAYLTGYVLLPMPLCLLLCVRMSQFNEIRISIFTDDLCSHAAAGSY